MKYSRTVPLALAGLLLCSPVASAADLIVTVTDIRNDQGNIRLAVYNKADEFPRGERFRGTDVAARKGSVQVEFKDIPPGIYALAIHHDENKDEEMNTYFLGIPKEGYGFANDARVIFGPPTFEAASFSVKGDRTEITLRARY
ncbi:MAG: DUF2141 domain-containing protein [Proteobacteria bacterium]|nr:DUF2141 domain-containing protein [Pseudomonadota bacterium]